MSFLIYPLTLLLTSLWKVMPQVNWNTRIWHFLRAMGHVGYITHCWHTQLCILHQVFLLLIAFVVITDAVVNKHPHFLQRLQFDFLIFIFCWFILDFECKRFVEPGFKHQFPLRLMNPVEFTKTLTSVIVNVFWLNLFMQQIVKQFTIIAPSLYIVKNKD